MSSLSFSRKLNFEISELTRMQLCLLQDTILWRIVLRRIENESNTSLYDLMGQRAGKVPLGSDGIIVLDSF